MAGWKCMGKDGAANKSVAIFQHVSAAQERATRTNRIAGTRTSLERAPVECPDVLKRLCFLYSVETAPH